MQTQDTASEICNLVDKNNDLIRRNEKLESLKKMFFEASEKQSVTIADYEGKITMLQEKKDKLEDLNKVYLQACTMHENELEVGRTEITTLKEENARLKTTIARGGGSSEAAKNLKTVNNTIMHQNTQLSQENKELKKENKDLVKKHNEMVARVNAFKPVEKKLASCEQFARVVEGKLIACKHDFNRMRILKEGVEKDLNDAKTAGADKTLAKTLKNLEDKVFSQVGLGTWLYSFILLIPRHRRTPSKCSSTTPKSSARPPPRQTSRSTSSARPSTACATSSCPSRVAFRRRPGSPMRTPGQTPVARST